jgi:hypothetical protein
MNADRPLPELLENCQSVLRTGTTPVLFTSSDVQLGILDQARSGMILIPVGSSRATSWFKFAADVDFNNCMPADQAPLPAGRLRRRSAASVAKPSTPTSYQPSAGTSG